MARAGFTNFQRFMRNNMSELVALEDNMKYMTSNLSNLVDDDLSDTFSTLSLDADQVLGVPYCSTDSAPFIPSPSIWNPEFDFDDHNPDSHANHQLHRPDSPNDLQEMGYFNHTSTLHVPWLQTSSVSPSPPSTPTPQLEESLFFNDFLALKEQPKMLNTIENALNPSQSSHNFHKKYPRRSHKRFTVVPDLKLKCTSDELVDLRQLKIGPAHLYFSEQKKIHLKLSNALTVLSHLANQRQEIEVEIYQINFTGNSTLTSYHYINRSKVYEFQYQLMQIIKVARSELTMSDMIFENLETYCSNNEPDFVFIGKFLIKQLAKSIENLMNISEFEIIQTNGTITILQSSKDLKEIHQVLDEFNRIVMEISVQLWALRVITQNYLGGSKKPKK